MAHNLTPPGLALCKKTKFHADKIPTILKGSGLFEGVGLATPSAHVVASVPTQLLVICKPVLWRMLAVQQVMALNLLQVLSRRIRAKEGGRNRTAVHALPTHMDFS